MITQNMLFTLYMVYILFKNLIVMIEDDRDANISTSLTIIIQSIIITRIHILSDPWELIFTWSTFVNTLRSIKSPFFLVAQTERSSKNFRFIIRSSRSLFFGQTARHRWESFNSMQWRFITFTDNIDVTRRCTFDSCCVSRF